MAEQAEQETLHNGQPVWKPEVHGLWRRFVDGDDGFYLDQGAINKARSEGQVVGSCRDCGGDLIVGPTQDPATSGSHVEWTDIVCHACGKERAAPNLRRLRRSSMHSRMPSGWWDARTAAIKLRKTLRSS